LNDAGPITFRIFDNGGDPAKLDVEVTGADIGTNGIYNDVTSLVGSLGSFGDKIIIDVDADTAWNLSGLNAGTVTVAGFTPISFNWVENLTGADSATGKTDTFVIDDLGVVTGDIVGRGGILEVEVTAGPIAIDGALAGFEMTRQTVDVDTDGKRGAGPDRCDAGCGGAECDERLGGGEWGGDADGVRTTGAGAGNGGRRCDGALHGAEDGRGVGHGQPDWRAGLWGERHA
jgi:hypothetical protein